MNNINPTYHAGNLVQRSRDNGQTGIFASVSAAQAGWQYLNMAALRLNNGQSYASQTGEHEHLSVVLGGRCNVRTSHGDYLNIGRRPNVFSGMPYAVYLPRRTDFLIEALSDGLEVASCWVASDTDYPARLITPADSQIELRGAGNASRQINSILPPGSACQRIVCVEVYTPSGNWSSYPPHKHDVHKVDAEGKLLEADLEEIYFYKLGGPAGGHAYQRIYTDDRAIDAVVVAHNHDAVLVPEGYHPVVSAHGYTTYYLNFLAGAAQSLANSDDPDLAWVRGTWQGMAVDPRLPIVNHAMEAE
jgi:5-deoxy-glucuronate isomerase